MKTFIYTVLLILLAALQTTFAYTIELFGVRPGFLLAFVVCVALLEGPVQGSMFGLASGLFMDVLSQGLFGFCAVTYLYAGLLCGLFSDHFFRRNSTAAFLFTVLAATVHGLLFYVFHFLIWGKGRFWLSVGTDIVPGALYTAFIAVLLYLLLEKVKRLRICSRR